MTDCDEQRWRELGIELHVKMDEAIAEAGLDVPGHPEDDAHNVAVGRALDMILAGKLREGIAWYNEWSAGAGYPGVSIVHAADPAQVDIGTAIGGMVAELRDGEVTILTAGDWVRPGYKRAPKSFCIPIAEWGRRVLPLKDNVV